MAQSNKFRTKRRRLNGKRDTANARLQMLWDATISDPKRAAHESMKSVLKRK